MLYLIGPGAGRQRRAGIDHGTAESIPQQDHTHDRAFRRLAETPTLSRVLWLPRNVGRSGSASRSLIDNRGGAGSIIGTELASKAPPDGYTLLMVSAAHVMNPSVTKKAALRFDQGLCTPISDGSRRAHRVRGASIAASPERSRNSIALAKARTAGATQLLPPAGSGTVGHLAGELFNTMEKCKAGANSRTRAPASRVPSTCWRAMCRCSLPACRR